MLREMACRTAPRMSDLALFGQEIVALPPATALRRLARAGFPSQDRHPFSEACTR